MPTDALTIILPKKNTLHNDPLQTLSEGFIKPSGSFTIQQEFDDKYAFTNLAFMQYMLDLDTNQYTGIEIAVNTQDDIETIQQQLQKNLGVNFMVKTRYGQNQSLFTVMEIEKWVIYAILSLILLVAAFNMIGALTMLVLEKEKDIAVLKAMGASDKRIQNIFLNVGFLLAGAGGILGMLIAFAICFLQIKYHLIKLEGGTFIIDYYPVKIVAQDFLLVGVTVMIIDVIASWLPATKAADQFYSLKS